MLDRVEIINYKWPGNGYEQLTITKDEILCHDSKQSSLAHNDYSYIHFYPTKEEIDNGLEENKAISICLYLGKKFINNFDYLFHNEDLIKPSKSKHHLINEFNIVKSIKILPTKRSLTNEELKDYFFSAGKKFDSYIEYATNDELSKYDEFIENVIKGEELNKPVFSIESAIVQEFYEFHECRVPIVSKENNWKIENEEAFGFLMYKIENLANEILEKYKSGSYFVIIDPSPSVKLYKNGKEIICVTNLIGRELSEAINEIVMPILEKYNVV